MKKSYMAAEDSDTGIKIYLREIGQIPLLTPDQEIDLAAKIKKGDREARALMIRSNLRLVVKIAHDYANLGLPLLDLISEGNIGLMKAVERFDPAKGGKLSTYAAWWIKQSIKRALANQSKTIRLPVHLVDKISKMRRVSLQMSNSAVSQRTMNSVMRSGSRAERFRNSKQCRSVPRHWMRRSATMIPPNSVKLSVMRMLKRRSNCCVTKICAMKSAVCSTCWMIVRRKSFSNGSAWMAANQRRSRKSARNSALHGSAFGSYRTSRSLSFAAL